MNFRGFKILGSKGTLLLMVFSIVAACSKDVDDKFGKEEKINEDKHTEFQLPNIDLSHWKVTLPVGDPIEVEPPEILDYATNKTLLPFMYNDSSDGALVFYTYPAVTTNNTSYSRTELREQMLPGSDSSNWTFAQGGRMRGTLAVSEVSKNEEGEFHRTIIMQIHGRLTDEQRDLIGEDDNNAPPILKIYWQKGKVRILTKKLKNPNISSEELLKEDAWEDDGGIYFQDEVGHDKFTLEVKVSDGKMTVTLNDNETLVYEGIHMEKWGVFENYFKAGNYLNTKDEGAHAKVKYYDLEVAH